MKNILLLKKQIPTIKKINFMKKIVLCALSLSMCLSSFAQSRQGKSIKDVGSAVNDKGTYAMESFSGNEIPLRSAVNATAPYDLSRLAPTIILLGQSTYDLQSNGSPVAGRVYNVGDDVGAAWTISSSTDIAFPDRGTAVAFSSLNGASWNPAPTTRIESDRRGFGALDKLGAGECVISHVSAAIPMNFYSRPVRGTGPWTSVAMPSVVNPTLNALWPAMRTGGPDGNSVHCVALSAPVGNMGAIYNGINGHLLYYRSLDGGQTWPPASSNVVLPGVDSNNYISFRANSYSIDVKDQTVAIVSGNLYNHWLLYKSTDNGDTWTNDTILAFPINRYDDATMNTDLNGDLVTDTILATDGSYAVVIDNNGMAHCFGGALRVWEDVGATGITLSLGTNGLLYWNEGMGTNPPVVIAQASDLDMDGLLSIGTIDATSRYGNMSACSMPTAGVDANNNIYVAYSSFIENTDDGLGHAFRNVFAKASTDGGASWQPEINVSSSLVDEGVYPSIARDVDATCMHLIWQQDAAPGTTVNASPVTPADVAILYACVDPVADLNVSVNEVNSVLTGISISPNPAIDYAMIQYNIKKAASIEVEVYNVTGQQVAAISQKANAGVNNVRIDVSELSSGIYAVTSRIDGEVFTSKLIVK